jgi:hypothetical protein
MDGGLLIKEVIKMYDDHGMKLGLTKPQMEHNHAVVCNFFAFVIDQDLEILFKDKRTPKG